MTFRKYTRAGINALLGDPNIRRVQHEGQEYFAAADVVAVLTGSDHAAEYWTDLLRREPELAACCEQLEMRSGDGAAEVVDAVDRQGLLRMVQSVPTPKAEKLKAWLAQSALERLEEEENPELAILRTRKLYEQRGYSRRWVDKRLRGVSARHELTSEWARRGATQSDEYRSLTNELMQAAFGMDVETYRRFKNLPAPSQNLRDHMTDLELILTMLGETTATVLHRDRDSRGYEDLLKDVRDAGAITLQTRERIEQQSGRPAIRRRWSAPASAPHPGQTAA